MVSTQASSTLVDPPSSPRISFSADFLDEAEFISISPGSSPSGVLDKGSGVIKNTDFEFLSSKSLNSSSTMLSADELIFEGKLLPYIQTKPVSEKPEKNSMKSSTESDNGNKEDGVGGQQTKTTTAIKMMSSRMEEPRIWYIDDDPSPRPPKCTVLWKELLRLKKNRPVAAYSLSPSSSSSSSSSSIGDHEEAMDEGKKSGQGMSAKEKHLRRIKKGLERTRSSTSIRIRPMVNVPICTTQGIKTSSLPPLFPLKKSRVPER